LCRADLQLLLSGKPGIPENQIEVCSGLEPPLAAVAEAVHYRLLALPDPREVDTDRSGSDTVVSTAAGEIGHACAGHHRLGRSTALVDAGPAYVHALHERRPSAGLSKSPSQRHCRLSSADDERVVVLHICHWGGLARRDRTSIGEDNGETRPRVKRFLRSGHGRPEPRNRYKGLYGLKVG